MTEHQTPPPADPTPAPPTTPGDMQPLPPPESWPTVIGVLGIIFGALGVLGAGCGAIAPAFMGAFEVMAPEGEEGEQFRTQLESSMPYPALQVGTNLIELALSVVLIVGSVQLLRRKSKAASILRGYAVGDLISNVLVMLTGILVSRAQTEAMMSTQTDEAAQAVGGFMQAFGVGGAIIGFVLTAIWPVFLLVWFGRQKVKESMARWQ